MLPRCFCRGVPKVYPSVSLCGLPLGSPGGSWVHLVRLSLWISNFPAVSPRLFSDASLVVFLCVFCDLPCGLPLVSIPDDCVDVFSIDFVCEAFLNYL